MMTIVSKKEYKRILAELENPDKIKHKIKLRMGPEDTSERKQ